jgi:protein translocase SecG subunit
MNLTTLLGIAQIGVSIAIIILVLLQERSSGTSGVFGGSGGDFHQTRRGAEKTMYTATIVLVIFFAGLALVNLVV